MIEKTELQENVESLKTEYEKKIKSLVQENGYLSEVVRELKKISCMSILLRFFTNDKRW